MSELSDLALLGNFGAFLVAVYLLRAHLSRKPKPADKRRSRKKRRNSKVPRGKIRVIVDGSNVMHWGGEPSQLVLRRVIDALKSKGFAPHVIFDANVGYKLGDRYMDDAPMAKLIGLHASQVLVVEKGVAADERILKVATEQNVRVVSNDQFRDWTVKFPIVRKKGRMIRGTWKGGNVVWEGI